MAKLIKRDGSTVSCRILEDCGGKYIIEANGRVGSVYENRVYDFDAFDKKAITDSRINEGFGDALKAAGRGLRNFGSNIKNMVVNYVKPILEKGFIWFLGNDGSKLALTHPVNMYKFGQTADFMEVYPSKSLMAATKYLNKEAQLNIQESVISVNELAFDDMYPDFTMRGSDVFYRVNENAARCKDAASEAMTFPAVNEAASPKDLINLYSEAYTPINTEDMTRLIWNQWSMGYDKPEWRKNVYCFFGAPGIGKTSIIRNVFAALYEQKNYQFTFTPINAAYLREDSMTIPGYSKDGMKAVEKPMEFLPVWSKYDIDKLVYGNLDAELFGTDDEENDLTVASVMDTQSGSRKSVVKKVRTREEAVAILDGLANGDVYDKQGNLVVKGVGGILFIDEFVRVKKEVVSQLMTMLSDREVGVSGFILGSRWVIVMASNRVKADMGGSDLADLNVDNAVPARFIPLEFVPDIKSWLEWAAEDNHILPEILSFLKKKGNEKYFYYNAKSSAGKNKELASKEIPWATPRRWENLTLAVKERFYMSDTLDRLSKTDDLFGTLSKHPKSAKFFQQKSVNKLEDVDPAALAGVVEAVMGIDVARPFLDFIQIDGITLDEAKMIYEGTWGTAKNAAFTESDTDFAAAFKSFYAYKLAEAAQPYINKNKFITKANWINVLDFMTFRMFKFRFSDYLRDFYKRTPEGDIVYSNEGEPAVTPILQWCKKNNVDPSYMERNMTSFKEGILFMIDRMVDLYHISRGFYQNSNFDDINNVNSPAYEYNDVNDALNGIFIAADQNFKAVDAY